MGKGDQKGKASFHQEQEKEITGPAPQAETVGRGRCMGPTARTLFTGGITITKRARFFVNYTLKPVLVQNLQGARVHTALRIAKEEKGKDLGTYTDSQG